MGIERLPTPQQAIGDKNKYRAIRLSNGIEALLIEGEKKIIRTRQPLPKNFLCFLLWYAKLSFVYPSSSE